MNAPLLGMLENSKQVCWGKLEVQNSAGHLDPVDEQFGGLIFWFLFF